MSLKKFISGVSALAVAATAFAAMAVTASAKDYTNQTPTKGTVINLTSNSDGTYAVNNTNLGAVVADLSDLKDIDKATSVTVQFDTEVPTITVSGKTRIAPIMYGVGDKAERGYNGNNTTKGNYVKQGLVTYFGSDNATNYYVEGDTSKDWASSVATKTVTARITLNRENGDYTTALKVGSATTTKSGNTDVDNITVIEAVTWGATGYNVTLKNIKVSYTVPDAPPTFVTSEVEISDDVDGDGVYAKAYTTDITYNGIAIENVKVEVPGAKEGAQTISFGGYSGDVRIGIILASEDATKLEGITPTVSVNVE